jgi:hypothetical protein
VKNKCHIDSMRVPKTGEPQQPTSTVDEDGILLNSDMPPSEHANTKIFLATLGEKVSEFMATAKEPHVAFLQATIGVRFEPEQLPMLTNGAKIADILSAAGICATAAQEKVGAYAASLLVAFPKKTLAGDKHSYVQYQQHPAAALTGTVHVAQLNPLLESFWGSDWSPIEAVVASILSGKVVQDRIKVTPMHASPFGPSPSMCGWAADGAPANFARLNGLCVVAYCAAKMLVNGAAPVGLTTWLRQFSVISVESQRFDNGANRVLSAWTDAVVARAVNTRLTPIMMAKSLIVFGVTWRLRNARIFCSAGSGQRPRFGNQGWGPFSSPWEPMGFWELWGGVQGIPGIPIGHPGSPRTQ